jgi:spore coat polysaccharide biosynthesis protein SpsF
MPTSSPPPRVIATIEARMASSRLPGKVMLPVGDAPMLQRLIERVRRAQRVDAVVVATTVKPEDQVIVDLCDRIGCPVHRGPVEDVAERLLGAAHGRRADVLAQLTGDNPLVDPAHIDETIRLLLAHGVDYAGNNFTGSFPIGFDVRALRVAALERSVALSADPADRVHGSYHIHRSPELFSRIGWEAPADLRRPGLRLTVDEPADYELIRRIFEALHPDNPAFTAADVLALLRARPDWPALNGGVRQKQAAEG